MRTRLIVFACLVVAAFLVCGCKPQSYVGPVEIHVSPGDYISQPTIAVDAQGYSHIAGVVDDRIVYYRTKFGPALETLTFTIGGTGEDWVQFDPEIAVTDDGTAYIVWVQQEGSPNKVACWQAIPFEEPGGGYEATCEHLDEGAATTGTVRVIALGDKVYAVYDRRYPDDGVDSIWYIDLTTLEGGLVYNYAFHLETGLLFSTDLAIDPEGNLHIAYIDDTGIFTDKRLWLNSNATTSMDGSMAQAWNPAGVSLVDVPVAISFYMDGAQLRVATASVWQPVTARTIWIDSCQADGCEVATHTSKKVVLPVEWDADGTMSAVDIAGIDNTLFLSFIGTFADNPSGVWYKDANGDGDPVDITQARGSLKYGIQMIRLDVPTNVWDVQALPVMGWGETNLLSTQFYYWDSLIYNPTLYDEDCVTELPVGDMASNGYFMAGVWDTCNATWFVNRAWMTDLPSIRK